MGFINFIKSLFAPEKNLQDLFAKTVSHVYLPNKIARSQKLSHHPRAPLPVLGKADKLGGITADLAMAVNEQLGKLTYQADPISGLLDQYNHPEHTQYLLETDSYESSSNDCDDYATYAQALFHAAGVYPENHWEWNILVHPAKQWKQARYNHVICGFRMGKMIGVIDTNTAARGKIFWFEGDLKSAEEYFIKHFKLIYRASYYKLMKGKWFETCYGKKI